MPLAPSERTESSATFVLPSTQPLTAADRASAILLGEGYRLEEGTATAAVYGVGSGLLRILLGAFARRNRFRVTVEPHESGSRLTVASAMSGTSGGLIGRRRQQKETARILDLFESQLL